MTFLCIDWNRDKTYTCLNDIGLKFYFLCTFKGQYKTNFH